MELVSQARLVCNWFFHEAEFTFYFVNQLRKTFILNKQNDKFCLDLTCTGLGNFIQLFFPCWCTVQVACLLYYYMSSTMN